MIYYSLTEKELPQLGIQEGELAIYTGTPNPRQPHGPSPCTNSKNAYVFLWSDGRKKELDEEFQRDDIGLEVLKLRDAEYAFLRDMECGYIRQISGPASPIVVANLGAIPLRVDTFLGRFIVYAGTALRLDETASQRARQKVLLTFCSWRSHPLKSAALWDGCSWRCLNIREKDHDLAVLDGNAIVQYMTVNDEGEILMMDAPEPESDYEILVAGELARDITLRFNRSDYQDGRVVQRMRNLRFSSWGEPLVYDLQKLRESPAQTEVSQCTVELHGLMAENTFIPRLPMQEETSVSRKKETVEDGESLLDYHEKIDVHEEVDRDIIQSLYDMIDEADKSVPVPEPVEDFPE